MDESTRMFACRWSSDLEPNDWAGSTVVNFSSRMFQVRGIK